MKSVLLLPVLPLRLSGLLFGLVLLIGAQACGAAESRPGLVACRLEGLEHEALCGQISRPLDPARPAGVHIELHFAVLPALARQRKPDPVFFFAGGPGQSAMSLAGSVAGLLSRLSNRRDIVLIDQRGTGRSAPLACDDEPPTAPLAPSLDAARSAARLRACLAKLQKLPYGDLRWFSTWIASEDAEAVRLALGAPQVDLVGVSYGTRAALDYARQYPSAVRRLVIDGVAPPDMAVPASFDQDNESALDQVFASCEADPVCSKSHPKLRAGWEAFLNSLPRAVQLAQPLTGVVETVTLTRDAVLGMVLPPLYVPALAAGLPAALAQASQGHLDALVGLSGATGGGGAAGKIYEGMHFSVVCAEDLPRLAQAHEPPGAEFGQRAARQYERDCAEWPRGAVPAAFYKIPALPVAALVLSGGADPVTPPRHGARVAQALGDKALHVVVPQAGHGVMGIPCMRDVVFRFVDADSDEAALKVDAACAHGIPRPPIFVPLATESAR
jgi:pimeloyl-ACP methyl ester carboxylesterase